MLPHAASVPDSPEAGRTRQHLVRLVVPSIQVALAVLYLVAVARFYTPGVGFTRFIAFPLDSGWELPLLNQTPHYQEPTGGGYDGQFYAQMALEPSLRDPRIDRALDLAPYRARRILFSWTAWVLGLGRPFWVLQAYALQNVACWLVLAWYLARRFPQRDARALAVWFGCLFGHGLLISTRLALADGPSMLLIVGAVAAFERGRPWLGSLVLGVSGLGRETNLLAGTALLAPGTHSVRQVLRIVGCGVLALLPTLIWLDYLRSIYRSGVFNGTGGFIVTPFVTYWRTWDAAVGSLTAHCLSSPALFGVLALIGLLVQAIYLVAAAQPKAVWWRVGFPYVFLMLTMHAVVWEGLPGASTRVLLPMSVAFNMLLPTGRWFWPLAILGNLSVVPGLLAIRA